MSRKVLTTSFPLKIRIKEDSNRRILVYALVVLPVYLWFAWFFLPPSALWSPDEGAKLLQTLNLRLDHNRLSYDITYSGLNFDPELRFAPTELSHGLLSKENGSLYLRRLPIFPLLVKPLFQFWGDFGLYLLPVLGGVATIALTLKIYPEGKAPFLAWFMIAFGSPVFFYAIIFWEHTLATSIALLAILLGIQTSSRDRASPRPQNIWILTGILLGGSVYLRLENIFLALGFLIVYSILNWPEKWGPVWACIVMLLVLLPYFPLHWILFHQGFPENTRYLFYPFLYLSRAGWRAIPDLLVGPNMQGEYSPGLAGDIWAFAAVLVIISSLLSRKSRIFVYLKFFGLSLSALIAAYFLFSPDLYRSAHGLLFTTPWVLNSLSQAPEIWQRGDRKIKVIMLTCILGLVGYAIAAIGLRATSPQGGLEWGARFVFSFYPLLAMMAVWEAVPKIRKSFSNLILVPMVILSVGFQARGVLNLQRDKQINAEINRILLGSVEKHIVSELWWLPFNAAPIYYQKEFFVSPTPENISEWIEIATSKNINQFALVTLDPDLPEKISEIMNQSRVGVVGIDKVDNVFMYHMIIEDNGL